MANNFNNRRRRHNSRQRLAELAATYRPQPALQPLAVSYFRAAHAEPLRTRRRFAAPVRVTYVRGNAQIAVTVYPGSYSSGK